MLENWPICSQAEFWEPRQRHHDDDADYSAGDESGTRGVTGGDGGVQETVSLPRSN